jgi:hypothetical protein
MKTEMDETFFQPDRVPPQVIHIFASKREFPFTCRRVIKPPVPAGERRPKQKSLQPGQFKRNLQYWQTICAAAFKYVAPLPTARCVMQKKAAPEFRGRPENRR